MIPSDANQPDPHQGHTRQWPSTPYSDEARATQPSLQTSCVLGLLGDCTVACSYFPPANRPENHLAVRLRRAFLGQPFVVQNLATDGESAADFMRSGRMDRAFGPLPRLDVAFVRYGINDRKQSGIAGCIESLATLCQAIQRRYEGVTVVIETGIWVDYPSHYLWDRNASLSPLNEAMREFARGSGYPLVDIFTRMEEQTRCGNWDLRVRGLPTPDHLIVDDAFDAFFGDDPAFFTNIHPNSRGLALIAQWEVETLQSACGEQLPL
jgi:acyl-CoA thioesterase-1